MTTNRFRTAHSATPLQEVSRNASNLAGDAFELTELQFKMLQNDFNSFRRRIWVAVWLLPIGLALAIAGFPVLALAIAGTLADLVDWPEYVGQWIVGVSFFLLAAVLGWIAARAVRGSLKAFNPSQRELQLNVRWLRQMLTGSEIANQTRDAGPAAEQPRA